MSAPKKFSEGYVDDVELKANVYRMEELRKEVEEIRERLVKAIGYFKEEKRIPPETKLGKIKMANVSISDAFEREKPQEIAEEVSKEVTELKEIDKKEAKKVEKSARDVIKCEEEKNIITKILSEIETSASNHNTEEVIKKFEDLKPEIKKIKGRKAKKIEDDLNKLIGAIRTREEESYLIQRNDEIQKWNYNIDLESCGRAIKDIYKEVFLKYKDIELIKKIRGKNSLVRIVKYQDEIKYIADMQEGMQKDESTDGWPFSYGRLFPVKYEGKKKGKGEKFVQNFRETYRDDETADKIKKAVNNYGAYGDRLPPWIKLFDEIRRELLQPGSKKKEMIDQTKADFNDIITKCASKLSEQRRDIMNKIKSDLTKKIEKRETKRVKNDLSKINKKIDNDYKGLQEEISSQDIVVLLDKIAECDNLETSAETLKKIDEQINSGRGLDEGMTRQERGYAYAISVLSYMQDKDMKTQMQYTTVLLKVFSDLEIENKRIIPLAETYNETMDYTDDLVEKKLKLYEDIVEDYRKVKNKIENILNRLGV